MGERHDLLVRGATVIDGSGRPGFRADVAVDGDRITAIGPLGGRTAATVVEADGLVVAPGFVDPHTHLDPQLHWDPYGTPSIFHGVTTVLTGNCSVTLAPCRPEHREALSRLFYLVEEIPLAAFEEGIDWSWGSFGEHLAALDGRLGLNMAPLVGHSAIRYHAMGPASYERAATAAEVDAMRALLRQSLLGGAVGFSTSQSVFHSGEEGRPIPSRLADDAEVTALCEVLAEFPGTLFQTDGGPLTHTVAEYVRRLAGPIAERLGITVLLSGTLQEWNIPGNWREVHDAVADFQARGARIYTQASPCSLEIEFALGTALVFQDRPTWEGILAMDRPAQVAAFRDPAVRDALQFETVDDTSPCFFSRDWSTVRVRAVARPEHEHLLGRTVADLAAERGVRVVDALADLALAEDLETRFVIDGAANGDRAAVGEMLRSPQAIVGFSDAGAHVNTLCGAGDTALLLSRWVRELGVLSLEQGVRALTFDPLSVIGVDDRGLLRPGWKADLVTFDPATIAYAPTTPVTDLPGGGARLVRDAPGIHTVIVNGAVVVADGALTDALPGEVLRGPSARVDEAAR
jgi:N-acyl-D-aspartate/D-glutamate deacylase